MYDKSDGPLEEGPQNVPLNVVREVQIECPVVESPKRSGRRDYNDEVGDDKSEDRYTKEVS